MHQYQEMSGKDAVEMLTNTLCLAIFCIAFSNNGPTRKVPVTINTKSVVNTVDESFMSFTIDSQVYYWKSFIDFSSPRFLTLMSALSPAFLRVGGTKADRLIYSETTRQSVGIVTSDNITTLVKASRSTGIRLIFGLNLQLRNETEWDSTNAEKLIQFCSQMDYCNSIGFQLGNEPEYYPRDNKSVVTPEKVGDGFVELYSILRSYANCQNSSISGPDVGRVTTPSIGRFFSSVVNMTGSFLKAATIHHYYFDGTNATKEIYMNPSYFPDLPNLIDKARSLLSKSKYPGVPLWLGETASGYGGLGGTPNVSNRFVDGFLWLEKLGIAAASGVKVVCRQELYRSYYALIDGKFNPYPSYWLSWIHKKLVGQKVFAVNLTGLPTPPTTRVYAHCTNTASSSYGPGAVTVFALNVDQNTTSALTFTGLFASQDYDFYLLEPGVPGDVLSTSVKLNGKTLTMPSDTAMPEIVPIGQSAGSSFPLPPATMAFFVFPNANIPLCY